ncbi:MAG: YihY/virulence factor BrkB family protein [Melioribacteraceae bacterium]|nr:YihY/virulence factor BrkB family protein [Melioribacteraceae bacterium]
MSRFKIFRIITRFISPGTFRKILCFFRHYVGGVFKRMDKNHLFLSGAGIAFSILLSLVPFILLSLSILGNIIDPNTIEDQIKRVIETIIPYPEYAGYVQKSIIKRIPDVIEYSTVTGYIGAFGLLFTSTWLFSSMRSVLNKIYKSEEERGAFWGLIRDFGMVLLVIIFIAMSTFILPVLNILIDAAEKVEILGVFRVSEFMDSIFSLIGILIIFLMFFTFYKLIPYAKLGKRIPVVSAFWATIFWELAKELFGYYVYDFLSENRVYGAFIIIVVVLFWLFYSSCLFILGAEIGQLYRERLEDRKQKIFSR